MAKKNFLVDIDLNKNELQNGVIQNLSADPANGEKGQLYYNTSVNKLRVFDGTEWVNLEKGNGTVSSVTINANAPLSVDDSSAIVSSGTRTISHNTSGADAGTYGDSSSQTPSYGETFKVPTVTVDTYGHVTGISEHTVKIPNSDNTDTTYTISADTAANKVVLTPSSGSAQSITVPYATSAGSASTATSATNDVNGDPINTTYVKKSGDTMTGSLILNNTSNGTTAINPFVIRRNTTDTEAVKQYIIDGGYNIDLTNDEANSNIKFTINNTDTEQHGGANANTSTVTFTGDSTGSTVTATKFVGTVTRATGDKNGNDITTTYYKASNPAGYTSNIGTITGVSMNGTSVATSGVANITSLPASILNGAIKNGVTATTQSQGDNSTKVATTAYVDAAIDALPEPMVFKGSLGTGGTITQLPAASSSNTGYTYKVITAGTYAGQAAKVGDTFVSDGSTWILIPSGDEPTGTVTSVKIQATSPIAVDNDAAITSSGTRTISHSTSGVTAGTYKSVTVNATGHVTAGSNPTTLSGYGITDAKINNGVITLGSNTITPLTSASTLDATKLSGTIPSGCYTNTTYSLTADTTNNKITLTPSNGSAQSITVPYATNADKATKDSDGNIINTTYLKKSGDAITGAITRSLAGSGTIANTNLFTVTGSTDGFKVDYAAPSSDKGVLTMTTLDDADAKLSIGNTIGGTYKEAIDVVNGVANVTGNAGTATKLQTPRTIGIGTGGTGTATNFDGSANITIPLTDVKDSYITWGGKNLAANISPIDAGCIDEFGHNKLSYLPASCITVDYTTDGGTTWIDYGLTDAQKIALTTTTGTACVIGKGTASAKTGTMTDANKGNFRVRVKISTRDSGGTGRLYTAAAKWLINMSTNGAGCKCLVEYRIIDNYNKGNDIWTTVGTYDISGWSGWNSIPWTGAFGGGANQTSQVADFRFTLYNTSINTAYDCNAQFLDFRLIGRTNWAMPSELARAGRLYTIDTNQSAIFPGDIIPQTNNVKNLGGSSYKWANVYATTFNGNATSATTASKATGDKNGNDITTTYYLASNPNGYTSNTGTVTSITLKATSPIAIDSSSAITTSGTRTLSHANSGVTAGTYRSVTVNATGHVTAGTNPTTLSGYGITDAKINNGVITLGSNTITPLTASSTLDATKVSGTLPTSTYTDTKNTAGSTDSSSKLFLVGATSQAANPQTYSQDTAYVGTDGHLYSNSKQVVNLSDSQALTNKTYNGYTLAAACAKAVVTSIDTSASLPTSNAVKTFVEGKNYNYSVDASVTNGTIDDLAVYTSGKSGMTGSVNLTKKSSGVGSEIATGWYNFIFSPHRHGIGGDNISYGNIILMPMTGSGTSYILRRSNSTTTISEVKPIITTDTKNTAGSTDTSSKIYLIGATSQAANPQTYSDNEVYATSGVLTTKSVQVGGTAATMQYNSTDKCIEFVFA